MMLLPPNKRWQIAETLPTDVDQALEAYPAYMRQILYNRGVRDDIQAQQFLDGREERGDPSLLIDMDKAIDRLLFAIDRHEPIAVYGDYDVDGVTATVLLVEVLRGLGGEVEAYIPNRFEEGYGLNKEALDILATKGVRVVVTVDCGIRSPREAEYANELGIDLIISDHHHPRDEIPDAWAVICPKRPGDPYPDKNLAGVGVAFKIAEGLLRKRRREGLIAAQWLDLVALGTVADIVPLTGENRALVRAGLSILRTGQRPGILSLAQVSGLSVAALSAGDIGFGLAPRLNAAGRLESALAAYDLLACQDVSVTGLLAQNLDDQNRERQRLTQEMQTEAEQQLVETGIDHLLFAFHPGFNSGVVGLVAAKLTDMYYRPSIVGTRGEEFTRASCRSIPEFHITQALDECADLMERHGGHALAAGFTIKNKNLEELMARLKNISERELGEKELRPTLRADLVIRLSDLRPDFLPYLDRLQPTGLGNPDAVFVSRKLMVMRARTVGADNRHLKLTVSDGKITYDAIAFRQGHWMDKLPERVDLLYQFEKNVYNGRESLQLNVRDLKPAGAPD